MPLIRVRLYIEILCLIHLNQVASIFIYFTDEAKIEKFLTRLFQNQYLKLSANYVRISYIHVLPTVYINARVFFLDYNPLRNQCRNETDIKFKIIKRNSQ